MFRAYAWCWHIDRDKGLLSVVAQLRPCAIAHWRTGASVSLLISWPQCGGPCAVALVCVFSSFISLDPGMTRVHGSSEKCDRTDSRACVAHFLNSTHPVGAALHLQGSFSVFGAPRSPRQTWLQAARCDFAYPFLLRVPSALLGQDSPSLLTLGEERTWYDPVRFAGKRTNLLALSHLACAKGLIP